MWRDELSREAVGSTDRSWGTGCAIVFWIGKIIGSLGVESGHEKDYGQMD